MNHREGVAVEGEDWNWWEGIWEVVWKPSAVETS